MEKVVELWDGREREQWLRGKPYPHKILTDEISYWPEPTDNARVCHYYFVFSYDFIISTHRTRVGYAISMIGLGRTQS
jgi:hypothetical protein